MKQFHELNPIIRQHISECIAATMLRNCHNETIDPKIDEELMQLWEANNLDVPGNWLQYDGDLEILQDEISINKLYAPYDECWIGHKVDVNKLHNLLYNQSQQYEKENGETFEESINWDYKHTHNGNL